MTGEDELDSGVEALVEALLEPGDRRSFDTDHLGSPFATESQGSVFGRSQWGVRGEGLERRADGPTS